MNKQELLRIVEELPDRFEAEQVIERLYLQAKLERAEAAVARGDVVSHTEVVRRSQEWFK